MSAVRRVAIGNDEASGYTTPDPERVPEDDAGFCDWFADDWGDPVEADDDWTVIGKRGLQTDDLAIAVAYGVEPVNDAEVGIAAWQQRDWFPMGDLADEWLRANDPHLHAAGVEDEIRAMLRQVGIELDDARQAFRKTGGRPSRDLRMLRERIAAALQPMWDDDRRRDFMARALQVDRKTLWRLLAKTAPRRI